MRTAVKIVATAGLGLILLSCAAAAPAPAPKPAEDTCGAAKLQYLVGKTKSEIPPTPKGAVWRVSCSTCMVTMDYSPTRLDIVFDTTTGIVTEVKCG